MARFFIGAAATPRPLPGAVPAHPFMAAPGVSAMHGDGYSSDVHPSAGPLGHSPRVKTRLGSPLFGGMCATVTFDRGGRLIALCAPFGRFELHLLAPRTLELLARYPLPIRPSSFAALMTLDIDAVMSDTSGGAYFYLDDRDRAVLADSRQRILRIGHRRTGGTWKFFVTDRWDLSAHVPHDCVGPTNWFPRGECDPITAVMPDVNGRIWWVTRHGRIGTLNPADGKVRVLTLRGEEVQNGFSVAADGVYIVSDHALYGLRAADDGTPTVTWREPYDRGTTRKVGSISRGSGTTPTLLGDRFVTITDNADGQIHALVYRRLPQVTGERLVCRVPLFTSGASATDNSMIGWGLSIIVENNHGYRNAIQQQQYDAVSGGIVRIDVRPNESGCDVVWRSAERVPSVVPKLSAGNGLAYFYTFEEHRGGDMAWYFTAVDARTGETAYKVLTGIGRNFDNNWAPITVGPDGTAYVGVLRGLVAIWDKE